MHAAAMPAAQISTLLGNRDLDRLARLRLNASRRFTNRARGEHLAAKGGASTEFCDFRDYSPGDDVRFGLLAGLFVGEGALLRFYVLHCVGFPLIAATLMAVHFWRVRKDGGISGPL